MEEGRSGLSGKKKVQHECPADQMVGQVGQAAGWCVRRAKEAARKMADRGRLQKYFWVYGRWVS